MKQPRVMCYDKTDGKVIKDFGTCSNVIKIKSDEELIQTYTDLQEYNRDNLGFIRLAWGEKEREFQTCSSYRIDINNDNKIIFNFNEKKNVIQTERIKFKTIKKLLSRKK